mgnify:CR=1 FL=1
MLEKLKELALRYEDLQAQLADPSVYGDAERLKTVNRELKDLTPVAEAYQAYRQAEADRAAAEELLSDPEMRELAQEELTAAREEMERLRQELGRGPVLSELSEASGLTPEEIAQVEIATDTPESLQRETADGLTLEGMLGTDAPEEGMVERIALRESIDQLPEKERMTILLRYFKGLTQEQTARILGVSQVQVSRLERRGLKRLREFLSL